MLSNDEVRAVKERVCELFGLLEQAVGDSPGSCDGSKIAEAQCVASRVQEMLFEASSRPNPSVTGCDDRR